jgi:plasmid stabilization system protein ParE
VRRVVWAESALSDYCGVIAYVATDDVAAAEKVAERIDHVIESLAFMPTGRRGRVAGTYETIVAGLVYIIAYSLSEELSGAETLTVLRIIHGARDWPESQWPDQ